MDDEATPGANQAPVPRGEEHERHEDEPGHADVDHHRVGRVASAPKRAGVDVERQLEDQAQGGDEKQRPGIRQERGEIAGLPREQLHEPTGEPDVDDRHDRHRPVAQPHHATHHDAYVVELSGAQALSDQRRAADSQRDSKHEGDGPGVNHGVRRRHLRVAQVRHEGREDTDPAHLHEHLDAYRQADAEHRAEQGRLRRPRAGRTVVAPNLRREHSGQQAQRDKKLGDDRTHRGARGT